ncbi:MAG: response regulator, partial [Pseudomonadota bacterium]|nr:response regulator [Pseudomonadota bacterium]
MTVVQEQMNNGTTVVDDADLLRKNIVEILVEAGYSVRAASTTGAEAQEQYEAEPANLVIFDISMPDIDGLELVRAFFDAGENIRLMAMSGHFGDVDYLEIPNALGAAQTLRKPFRKMEILNTVETYLSQSSRSSAD